jgi:Tfp pilus assembly protein PilZ
VSRGPARRDTRKHTRGTLELPVLVSDAHSKAKVGIRFDAADVSGGGAFLRSDLLFEVGELLLLQFALPSGRKLKVRGRVVRASRDGGAEHQAGMGVEFVDLSADDRAAIEAQLP